jgi:hypothetical protein
MDATAKIVVQNVADIDAIDAGVERCRNSLSNPTPECLNALLKYLAKKNEVIAVRNDLQQTVTRIMTTLVPSIFDALHARELVKLLAVLMQELKNVVKEIGNQCGCRFLLGA